MVDHTADSAITANSENDGGKQCEGKTPCLLAMHKHEHERSLKGSMSSVCMQEGGQLLFLSADPIPIGSLFATHSGVSRVVDTFICFILFRFILFLASGSYLVLHFRISTM